MNQQWPIPLLWNTSGNWYNNVVQQVPPPDYHAFVNMWRAAQNMQQQQQPQQPLSQMPFNRARWVAENAPTAAAGHAPVLGHQLLGRAQTQPDYSLAPAAVHMHVANAVPAAVATPAPKSIAKTIAARPITSESPNPVRHRSEIAAATAARLPTCNVPPTVTVAAGDDSCTLLGEADPPRPLPSLHADSPAKLKRVAATVRIAEPQTAAAVAAPAAGQSVPSSKHSTPAGPTRPRGQGTTCVNRGELCAQAALERIFPGKTFQKVRPDWLRNDRTGRALEIDLYNDQLRLGVEVQGAQHYVHPNSWHKTRQEFDAQVYRDTLKRQLCAQSGCLLLEVPFTVPHAAMETYIRSEIDRLSSENDA
jgi:hypothetical protein